MQTAAREPSNARVVLFSAFAATVSAIWGHDSVACHGLLAGAMSTLMRAGFLVFVHPWTLAACLGLMAAFAGVAYCLTLGPPFRKRVELLTFVFPVAAFLAGIAVGRSGIFELTCALHPWA